MKHPEQETLPAGEPREAEKPIILTFRVRERIGPALIDIGALRRCRSKNPVT